MRGSESDVRRSVTWPRLQGWMLFGCLAFPLLVAEISIARAIDWTNPLDVRWLMGINWRLAAPYFLLTFVASQVQKLWPGRTTRWLVANRRYIGLTFAVGALCQIAPIATLALRFPSTLADVHSASSQFGEDCIFVLVLLMTVTSFRATNRYLSRAAWQRLHSTGMYLLAGLYSVAYVYDAIYTPSTTNVPIAVAFAAAWALRMTMWWRTRAQLQGKRAQWAAAGLTSGIMLASWSWFGIESEASLTVVLRIAAALGCSMFLFAASVGMLRLVWRGRRLARLAAEGNAFFVASATALAWFGAFALAGRLTVANASALPGPLPLSIAMACAMLWLGTQLLRTHPTVSPGST